MKKSVLLLLAGVSGATLAAVHTFPQVPWSETKAVTAANGDVRVVDAKGATLFTVVSEPAGKMKGVTVTPTARALFVDPSAAFKAGARKVNIRSAAFEDASFQDEDVIFQARVAGPSGVFLETYLQMWKRNAAGERRFHVLWGCDRAVASPARARSFTKMAKCAKETGGYQLRVDLKGAGAAPFAFFGGRVASGADLAAEERAAVPPSPPKLLFMATFDEGPAACVAAGRAAPLVARNLAYEPGVRGHAVRLASAAKGALTYDFKGNVDPRRGAISLWVRYDAAVRRGRRWLFTSPLDFNARFGTGALYLWQWDDVLRGDVSDDGDSYVTRSFPVDDAWHHFVYSWDGTGSSLTIDGKGTGGVATTLEPVAHAMSAVWGEAVKGDFGADGAFDSFSLGGYRGGEAFDGLIDEVEIWSGPLGREKILELYRAGNPPPPAKIDYAALAAHPNPHEGTVARQAGVPENLELVAAWTADEIARAAKFASVGAWRRGTLAGVPFIEAGSNQYDRVAFGFSVDPKVPLHVIEIDYPDDGFRTIDYIVQDALHPRDDYTLQVGVATGRDYPCTGRILTHRCLYWTRAADLALLAMTCNAGAPAALAAVRVYRVRDGRLPVARMNEPPATNGWGRTVGQYWEDVAMNYDFSIADPASPTGVVQMAERVAALMKFTGENLYAYPGVWYDGLIASDGYNPRTHAPDFLTAFYEVFDREGLSFVPLLNQNRRPTPVGLMSYAKLRSGAVHGTMLSVTSGGSAEKPPIRGPSGWNIAHPEMRRYLSAQIDALLAQGVRHPSFKGIGLHVKHPGLEWFGSLEGGYNDYCIDAFERATGVKVPVDRADPKRGKAYAAWLRAQAYEKWVAWRCDVVTGFWVGEARKLAAARPDLKLWVNNIADIDALMDGFREADHVTRMMREGGFDAARLAREAPNVILGQSMFPADSRFFTPKGYYPTAEDRAHQRVMHLAPGYWDFMRASAYPLAHQHDRYFESPHGDPRRNPDPARRFHVPWLVEHPWRVSTINPSGRNALAWYATPLRHQDVLGLTKGGFLVGTYGMEDVLAPFAQAFRALPPVRMDEAARFGDVVVRTCVYAGKRYFYAVNTGARAAQIRFAFPKGTRDLVTGAALDVAAPLALPPYDLRAFAAPQTVAP